MAPGLALRLFEPGRARLGPIGERLARRALRRAGLRVLAANLHHRDCELDLVLEDGDVLVVCEVKTSRCRADARLGELRFRPADRVDPERVLRLCSAARSLGRERRTSARVDVVEVWIAGARRRTEIAWHRDVGRDGPNWSPRATPASLLPASREPARGTAARG
ncbi:MAG: YraN family protein [Planctomycetota bacterium]